jgi:transcription-repair coupling factor (superfamily II helicase)
MPEEVQHLLSVLAIKIDCLAAGIEKIDAGPKGIAVVFRNQNFANPEKLLAHVSSHQKRIKIRPDQSLVFRAKAEDADERLRISGIVAGQLAELAA